MTEKFIFEGEYAVPFRFCNQLDLFSGITCSSYQRNLSGIQGRRPVKNLENVSTIHGDYTEVEVDLVVAAPDSLVLSRFYSSRDTMPIATFGGWRFYPHCYLKIQKDPKARSYSSPEGKCERTLVYVGNPEGSILSYVGWWNSADVIKAVSFKIDAEGETLGLANTARGDVSAWTNRKNNDLHYHPQTDSFELLLCNEGKRFYVRISDDIYRITHEILPKGLLVFETDQLENETHYSYDANHNLIREEHANTRRSNEYAYDLRNRLISITETDQNGDQFKTETAYDAIGYR